MSSGKFKPKIPVRRQEEEKKEVPPPKPATTKPDDKRGPGRGNKSGRGAAGRGPGRGNFLQPTGKAFFTGGGVSSSTSTAQPVVSVSDSTSISVPVKSESLAGGGGYGITAQLKGQKDEEDYLNEDDGMSVDSDEEQGPASTVVRQRVEVWPPVEHSTTAPLALPFGPRSQLRRLELLNQPLFAHPDDATALTAEERSEMLLLQLPSTLLASDNVLSSGFVGKLQVMKSGKVFLVLDSERCAAASANEETFTRYEITSGIPNTIKQVAACIDTTSNDNSTDAAASSGGAGLYLLGSVTKKAVVTPDFDSKFVSVATQEPIDLST